MLCFLDQPFEERVCLFNVAVTNLEVDVGFPDVFRLVQCQADARPIDSYFVDSSCTLDFAKSGFEFSVCYPGFAVVLEDFYLTLVDFATTIDFAELQFKFSVCFEDLLLWAHSKGHTENFSCLVEITLSDEELGVKDPEFAE